MSNDQPTKYDAAALQRDIKLMDDLLYAWNAPKDVAAWQRIRARLTPDRERVAMAISRAVTANFDDLPWVEVRLIAADAAIEAMLEGVPRG